MTEEPKSVQGIESSLGTKSPSTGEGEHHLGWIYQVSHSNSLKNPTDINLDTAILDSTSGEEHNAPS